MLSNVFAENTILHVCLWVIETKLSGEITLMVDHFPELSESD